MMTSARFCSECGARLKVKRPAVLPLRAFCPRCAPRFRTVRLLLAAPVILATIAFVVSRFGAHPEPFYFIGTQIDASRTNSSSSVNDRPSNSLRSNESLQSSEQDVKAANSAVGICGAPTKSGKPCQRKVKGGGYCWQHREKSSENGSTRRE